LKAFLPQDYADGKGVGHTVISRDESFLILLLNVDYDQEVKLDGGMIQFKEVDTDVFTSGEWESITSYKFNDGSTNIPQDLPTLVTNRNYTSIGFKAVELLFSGIIFELSIGFGLWAYINCNRQVLRSLQPFFCM
jgi:hypothetical protein